MDNAEETGVRVTRSQRKRLTSVESDLSRSSTPTLQKLNPILEIGSPSKPLRRTRRNSGTDFMVGTPSKLASNNTPDINSPSVRLSARKRTLSNASNDEQIMNSAKSAVARRPKFDALVEENGKTQNLSTTPGRRVTRSQSISPPQVLELPNIRKRKSLAKFNESIVEETVEEEQQDAETALENKEPARPLVTLEPINEVEPSGPAPEKSIVESSKSVVFNESIIMDDTVAKTVYPKTPMNLKGGSCLTKDMDISFLPKSGLNESFGQAKTKLNKSHESDKLNDEDANIDMEMDMSLMQKKMPELLRKSSTPIFSIKLKRLTTPENESKEQSVMSETPATQQPKNDELADKKDESNAKNSANKANNKPHDDSDDNNNDESNRSQSKLKVRKSNSFLLQQLDTVKEINSPKARNSVSKTPLKYCDENDMEMKTSQKSIDNDKSLSQKTPQSQKKASPIKSANKSQSLLLNFFNSSAKLSTSKTLSFSNDKKVNTTPKERKNSSKTIYVNDDDDEFNVALEVSKENINSIEKNTPKNRRSSSKTLHVDDDEVDDFEMALEVSKENINNSIGKNTPKKRRSSSKTIHVDDDDEVDDNDKELEVSNENINQSIDKNTHKNRRSSSKTLYVDDDEFESDTKELEVPKENINHSIGKNTPKKRRSSSKTLYVDDDDEFESDNKDLEVPKENINNSIGKNTPKKRRSSSKTIHVDDDDEVDDDDKELEVSNENINQSIDKNTHKNRRSSSKTLYVDDDEFESDNKELEVPKENINHSIEKNTPKKRRSSSKTLYVDDDEFESDTKELEVPNENINQSIDKNTPKKRRSTIYVDDNDVDDSNEELEVPKENVNNSIEKNTPKKRRSSSKTIHVDDDEVDDFEMALDVSKENINNSITKNKPSICTLPSKASHKKLDENELDNLEVENASVQLAEKSINESAVQNEQETETNMIQNKITDQDIGEMNDEENIENKLNKSSDKIKRASLSQGWSMTVCGKSGDKIDHIENTKKNTPKKLNESIKNTSLGSSSKNRKSKSLLLTKDESVADNADDTLTEVNNYFNNICEEDNNSSKIDVIDEKEGATSQNDNRNDSKVGEKKKRKSKSILQILSDDDDDDNVGNDTEAQVDNYFRVEEDEEELDENEKCYKKSIFIKSSVIEVGEDYVSGDSMDSEERAEIEDNEILYDCESLGSEDTDIDEQDDDDDENDSFIESDAEMELLDSDDDIENEKSLASALSSEKKNKKRLSRIVSSWTDSEEEQEENEKENNVGEENKHYSEGEIRDDEEVEEKEDDNDKEVEEKDYEEEEEKDDDEEKEEDQDEGEEENKDVKNKNQSLNSSTKEATKIENDEGKYYDGATWGTASSSKKYAQDDEEAAFSDNDDNEDYANEKNSESEAEEKTNEKTSDKMSQVEEKNTRFSISSARQSLSKTDSGVNMSKASQSFAEIEMDDDEADSKKRKRLSRSFCVGESLDASNMMMQHMHKKSKLVEPTEVEENQATMAEEDDEQEFQTIEPLVQDMEKNVKNDEAQQAKSTVEEKHLRIQTRIEEMLEAANKAQLEAKLNAKKNAIKKPRLNKKKHNKITQQSSVAMEMKSTESQENEKTHEKEKIKKAISQALKTSSDILLNKIDKKNKQALLNKLKEEHSKAQRCHEENTPSASATQKKKTKATKELEIKKLSTAAGEVVILPTTPPPHHKKSKVREIKLSTGVVRIEPSSPVSKPSVKRTNVGILREDPATPHSLGFKVRQIFNCGQDEIPDLSAVYKHGKKRKRVMRELTYSLPQPQWTSSGVFKEETRQQVFKAPTGKKVLVTSLSPNGNNSVAEKHMKKKYNNNGQYNGGGSAVDSALQFKKQMLQRSDVPRQSPLELINRKKRQELKQR